MIDFLFTFIMLGFFSFGGGYAFLPLMQSELVDRLHWLTQEQFVLALTAGQISPGPVAVAGSFAGFLIGYHWTGAFSGGLLYGFLAWVGTNVATILCMGIIMRWYEKIARHPAVPFLLQFIMPAVIGMILYLALKMGVGDIADLLSLKPGTLYGIAPQLVLGVAAFLLAYYRKLGYAVIIIGSGIAGYFLLP